MKQRVFLMNIGLGLAIWLCGNQILAAQAEPANGVLVHTVVTVEPHRGANPPVINREDVMVYEGKNRDKVTEWVPAQGENATLELFILLDDGSNVSLGTQLEDLRKFIDAQPASTKIGVAYMQEGAARIEQNLTSDHAQAAKALRLPMGIRGVNGSPYFAVSDLVKHWPGTSARRAVFMASDGVDLYYGTGDLQDPYLAEAISDAQRAGIAVSAIYTPSSGHVGHSYWLNYWGQLYLAELAEKTGGEAYYIGFTGPPVSFSPYLDQLTHRLDHQFLLTFLARPQKKSGMQRIKIKTEVPNADLVAPEEVFVPAGQ